MGDRLCPVAHGARDFHDLSETARQSIHFPVGCRRLNNGLGDRRNFIAFGDGRSGDSFGDP